MKLFISWSGEASKNIAEGLKSFLEQVIQNLDIYLSTNSIRAGEKWQDSINENLEDSNYGILCLTPDNLDSRWILFESGALSKAVGDAFVVPLLFEVGSADVAPPFSQFQMKVCDAEGIASLTKEINATSKQAIRSEVLEKSIAAFTQELEDVFDEVKNQLSVTGPPKRGEREILEEILSEVRRPPDGRFKDYVIHGRDLARWAGELRNIGGSDLQLVGSSSQRKMKALIPKGFDPSVKNSMIEAANQAKVDLRFETDNFDRFNLE